MFTITTMIFLPTPIKAIHEESIGKIEQIGLDTALARDDLRALLQKQIDNKEDVIDNKQDLNLSNYTQLQTIESPEKHTLIAQLDLSPQNGNTTMQLDQQQLNELMHLIDDAKSKCWQITGFTSLDPYLFILLEAFTCS